MFTTDMEAIENGFILTVRYNVFMKRWQFRSYEELVEVRRRMELQYIEGQTDYLKEAMV